MGPSTEQRERSGVADPGGVARRRSGPPEVVWLAALFAAAAAVYTVLATRVPLPVLFPDEFRYSHLARSLADGQGFVWRGQSVGQTAALYVYFLTPAWAVLHSTVDAWHAAKVLGTLALCAQVVPVWLLARDLLRSPRLALAAAALSVAGTWMLTSAEATTEILAFPLATSALCLAVLALRRPGTRLAWLALAFALLAAWARIQVAVLIPALAAAFLLDALRVPERRAERLRAHGPFLAVIGALTAAMVVLAVADPSITGDYGGYFDMRPPLTETLRRTASQLMELTALSGFVPVLLAAGAALTPAAWRDDKTGPLLAVFWTAALATALQSGFYAAGYPQPLAAIGRYVTYAAPIGLVLALVLIRERRLLTGRVLTVASVLALGLLARPHLVEIGEERASWSTGFRVHQLLQIPTPVGLALVALALLGAVALIADRLAGGARAVAVLAAVLGVVFVIQDQASWHQMTRTASVFRSTFAPDLEWVDHHAGGPVALLGITQNAPQFDDVDFFNRDITQAYVPTAGLPGRAVQGRLCGFRFLQSGLVQFDRGCGPAPHRFLINDPSARVHFRDEVGSAQTPELGRVVSVAPDRAARVRSMVILPCPRSSPTFSPTSPDIIGAGHAMTCRATFTAALWQDAPGRVVLRYRGGRAPQVVTIGQRRWTLAPRVVTEIDVPVGTGYSTVVAQHDWTSSAGTPQIVSAQVVQGRTAAPLL